MATKKRGKLAASNSGSKTSNVRSAAGRVKSKTTINFVRSVRKK